MIRRVLNLVVALALVGGGVVIAARIAEFVATCANAQVVDNLGTQGYFSLMGVAAAMVGNSSSGIIESPSFGLPVVNIGTRQYGRVRAANVIDVGYTANEVGAGIDRALSGEFRESLLDMENPYGNKRAAEKIVDHLKRIELGDGLLRKTFYDSQSQPPA